MQAPSANRHFLRSFRVIFALMMREMSTTYGRSYFGYLWAVLDPIGGILVLSVAFSLAFAAPALGDSFPLFYATGYMPFVIYNTMQQKVNGAIRENRQLLFYPRVTYLDAIFARFILTLITQLLVALIVYIGIILVFSIHINLDIGPIVGAIFAASVLGLGVGALNSVIVHLAPGWRHMWGILTRPLFLISCIFYLFDSLPTWAQAILWYNPLIHLVGLTRVGFYPVYDGDYVLIWYPCGIGLVTFLAALIMLRRYAKEMVNS